MSNEDLFEPQRNEHSDEKRPAPSSTTVTAEFSQSYSGPLPPAKELAEYEKVLPGAAERIVAMAEGFAAHRQDLEKEAMRQERNEQRWARKVAAGVVLAVLLTCLVALLLDKEEFATSLGSWTIVALATVFIAGKLPDWFANFIAKRDP